MQPSAIAPRLTGGSICLGELHAGLDVDGRDVLLDILFGICLILVQDDLPFSICSFALWIVATSALCSSMMSCALMVALQAITVAVTPQTAALMIIMVGLAFLSL